MVSNSAKRDANGFFKVLLLSSHLLISQHPVQKSKSGACSVTVYCFFKRAILTTFPTRALCRAPVPFATALLSQVFSLLVSSLSHESMVLSSSVSLPHHTSLAIDGSYSTCFRSNKVSNIKEKREHGLAVLLISRPIFF